MDERGRGEDEKGRRRLQGCHRQPGLELPGQSPHIVEIANAGVATGWRGSQR